MKIIVRVFPSKTSIYMHDPEKLIKQLFSHIANCISISSIRPFGSESNNDFDDVDDSAASHLSLAERRNAYVIECQPKGNLEEDAVATLVRKLLMHNNIITLQSINYTPRMPLRTVMK